MKKSTLQKKLTALKTEFGIYLFSQGLTDRTVKDYKEQLGHFFHFMLIQDKPIDEIEFTCELVKAYREYLSGEDEALMLLIQMSRLLAVKRFCEFMFEKNVKQSGI